MGQPLENSTKVFMEEIERYSDRLQTIAETLLDVEKVEIATSEKDLVFQQDKVKLYHFRPKMDNLLSPPLLVTYALVNRETMMDLEEGKSLIGNLLRKGVDVYIIVWGYPSRVDRYRTLDDYIEMYLDDCVEYIKKEKKVDKVNLMGVCQGGTFAAIYTALYPEKIKNLVTMVTPIDFGVEDGLLNLWAKYMDVDLMVDTFGNIPGDFMNLGFIMLKPFQLMMDKYVGLVESAHDKAIIENFLRMEQWIFDSPDQAGETFRKFLNDLFKGNKLIKGELEIGNRKVDLKSINVPVLNIYAEEDHLVPPSSSKPLAQYISSQDVTTKSFPVGHIGMYVSSKSQKELAPFIAEWIRDRSEQVKKKTGKRILTKHAPSPK